MVVFLEWSVLELLFYNEYWVCFSHHFFSSCVRTGYAHWSTVVSILLGVY